MANHRKSVLVQPNDNKCIHQSVFLKVPFHAVSFILSTLCILSLDLSCYSVFVFICAALPPYLACFIHPISPPQHARAQHVDQCISCELWVEEKHVKGIMRGEWKGQTVASEKTDCTKQRRRGSTNEDRETNKRKRSRDEIWGVDNTMKAQHETGLWRNRLTITKVLSQPS